MVAAREKVFKKKNRVVRWIILFFVIVAGFCLFVERNLRPVVLNMAEAKSIALATRLINEAMNEATDGRVNYEDLMNVICDAQGRVSMVQANTVRMNDVSTAVVNAAEAQLDSMRTEAVGIPLGSALGSQVLAASGPVIPVQVVPIGGVQTEFHTEFETSGINQTRHKIYMTVTAWIRVVIPTQAREVEVSNNLLLAESIIVGDVPNSFVGYNPDGNLLNLVP
ncbi:sporulation protein YunB [Beduinella massiliensis]|uniref:sporulation protein YunB n=1 Tax=Beduinella massiliensis TaxID=1852363 RepID=UPI000C825FFC